MATKEMLNEYLEAFYACEEQIKDKFSSDEVEEDQNQPFLITGSLKEGAWAIPLMIPVEGKSCDMDVLMRVRLDDILALSSLLLETAYPGYYIIF